jgi:hypothetical protein
METHSGHPSRYYKLETKVVLNINGIGFSESSIFNLGANF